MSLIAELRRRNVFKVAVAYVVVTWLTIQVIDVLIPMLSLPEWIGRALLLTLIVGFPVAIVLAWAYELTPDGVKREGDVDRSVSVTVSTGRKLDFIIIAVLVAALAVFAVDKFVSVPSATNIDGQLSRADRTTSRSISDDVQVVAVVPFDDMSPNKDQNLIGETIATELMTELSKRSDLRLLSRSTAFSIPNDIETSQDIGNYLGVDILVEGTVRRVGDRIRVTAQLVSVADGYQLWADVFESKLSQDFSAEITVAEFFSSQVRAQLAAPFRPTVQLVNFEQQSSSAFENLLIAPASAESQRPSEDSEAGGVDAE